MTLQFRKDICKGVILKLLISIFVIIFLISLPSYLVQILYDYDFIVDIGPKEDDQKILMKCLNGDYFCCFMVIVFMMVSLHVIIPLFLSPVFIIFYLGLNNYEDEKRNPQNRYSREISLNLIFLLLSPIISGLLGLVLSNNECFQGKRIIFPFFPCQWVGFMPLLASYFVFHLAIFYYAHKYKKVVYSENKKEDIEV